MSGTVLVTGGSGLVGGDTVKRLSADGWRVVATTHRAGIAGLPAGTQTRRVDLGDADAVDAAVRDVAPAAIVHLAAVIPPQAYRNRAAARRVNVDATATLVKAAERQSNPPHFVYASSGSVYGGRNPHRVTDLIGPDTPAHPCELYGGQKLEAEEIVRASSLPWAVLRLGGVFSVDPDAMPFTSDLLYFGGVVPNDSRVHTVDSRDVAAAFAAVLRTGLTDEVLLIGGDKTHLLLQGDLKQGLARARGLSRLPMGRPGDPDSDTQWYAIGDWMDVTRSQQLLSYHHHTWPELLDELRFNCGWKRYPAQLASPLICAVLERRAPYRRSPGRYAVVWASIRTGLGDPDLDRRPAQ